MMMVIFIVKLYLLFYYIDTKYAKLFKGKKKGPPPEKFDDKVIALFKEAFESFQVGEHVRTIKKLFYKLLTLYKN